MLRRVSDLQRFTVAAADGKLGSVWDLCFDDRSWTVRYLVVDVGAWLPGRWGLVSPISVQVSDPDPRTLRVALSRRQVTTSPASGTSRMLPASPAAQGGRGDPHLQTATAVMGYAVETEDGEIGHVADALVDDKAWAIRYLVVDTEHRWRGKKVLVSPEWLARITWDESRKLSCIVTAVGR